MVASRARRDPGGSPAGGSFACACAVRAWLILREPHRGEGPIVGLWLHHMRANEASKTLRFCIADTASPNGCRFRRQRQEFCHMLPPGAIVVGDQQQTLAVWPMQRVGEQGQPGEMDRLAGRGKSICGSGAAALASRLPLISLPIRLRVVRRSASKPGLIGASTISPCEGIGSSV